MTRKPKRNLQDVQICLTRMIWMLMKTWQKYQIQLFTHNYKCNEGTLKRFKYARCNIIEKVRKGKQTEIIFRKTKKTNYNLGKGAGWAVGESNGAVAAEGPWWPPPFNVVAAEALWWAPALALFLFGCESLLRSTLDWWWDIYNGLWINLLRFFFFFYLNPFLCL